jgi:DNA polymerase-4
VVAAASYEARAFGVHSAQPSMHARRLCPDAVFLPGDHAYYGEISGRVMDILRSFTPLVEPISLDEAFLDVTGALRRLGMGEAIAGAMGWEIRERVGTEEHLGCSVGVAPNKMLAKLASEAAKPRATPQGPRPGLGVRVVTPDEALSFLHALPVTALWGVGPATLTRLERLGVRTVGELAELPEPSLVTALGQAHGRHLSELARGIDDRPVLPDQPPKSIGQEETFARDHHAAEPLEREVVRLAESVAARLRANRVAGRTVTLKLRFADFTTITRSSTAAEPVDTAPAIARAAKALLARIDPTPGVRLLGVTVSGLIDAGVRQLALLDADASNRSESWGDASRAVDRIRGRFGSTSIGPATLLDGPGDMGIRRPGERQWGPNDPPNEP